MGAVPPPSDRRRYETGSSLSSYPLGSIPVISRKTLRTKSRYSRQWVTQAFPKFFTCFFFYPEGRELAEIEKDSIETALESYWFVSSKWTARLQSFYNTWICNISSLDLTKFFYSKKCLASSKRELKENFNFNFIFLERWCVSQAIFWIHKRYNKKIQFVAFFNSLRFCISFDKVPKII